MLLEGMDSVRAERLDVDTLQVYALKPYLLGLREEGTYAVMGRNGIALVETPRLRVELEVLRGGEKLHEQCVPGPVTLQVLEGAIRFHLGDEVFRVRAGEILAVPEGFPHSIEAVCDSAFVLTIVRVEDEKASARQ